MVMAATLLDLFCGAGGAAMGYAQAGFTYIIGVDIHPQPRYPFQLAGINGTFIKEDALGVLRKLIAGEYGPTGIQAIHASPPCQRYSVNTKQHGTMDEHPDFIAELRELLKATGLPYVIENVPGAPLLAPVTLCGSMFEVWPMRERLRRHRLFESNVKLIAPKCRHYLQHHCISVTGHAGGSSKRDGSGRFGSTQDWKDLMGVDWMTGKELAERSEE